MKNNSVSQNGEVCIEVTELWKIFGNNVEQILNSETRYADRETIREQTGCTITLRNVSFSVNRGEILAITGLSGSGKSTLLRCILRLTEPTAGKIIINGEDICRYNGHQLAYLRRHTIGMIFQHFGLLPHRNVIDNVSFGLKIRGVPKEERYARAREVMAKVGLKEWENHLPGALSSSMQQGVGIARALANDPEILIMDDPFRGFDPLIRRQMQDEMLEIQSEVQKTILFVTHDLDEALKLGNRIAIMKDGEIIQVGTPEEVIIAPSDAYVREFVQDASPARVMTASTIMEQPSLLLYEWQGPKAAMHMLRTKGVVEAFLVSRTGKLLGMITLDRLIELFRNKGQSVKEALELDLLTCTGDTVMEDLFPLAASTQYPIAVVDENGKFLGEIHTSTILVSMIQEKEMGDEDAKTENTDDDKVKAEETKTDA